MGRALSVMLVEDGQDGAAEAAAGLTQLGMTVRRCTPTAFAHETAHTRADAVLTFSALASGSGGLPHLSIGVRDAGAGAFLHGPAHPTQIAARLRGLVRLSVLEDIARMRARDAEAAGANIAPAQTGSEQSSVLFVGAPCPAFMRLQHALSGANMEVIGAFSTFTAFDYLHERAFDAVVLNTDPDPDLAHTVCSAMRRNTRLYHTPAILLARGESYAQADEAFARGASDVLSARADEDEMRERIGALGLERRRRRWAKARLESCRATSLMDPYSDLYGPAFGARHLDSLLLDRRQSGRRLSLVGLNTEAPDDAGPERTRHALDQFAAMLRHCVRAEDLAVRQSSGAFFLALPNTPAEEARLVADRVCAIAECTAYEGSDPARPFRLSLAAQVIEPDLDWSADQAVTAVLAGARRPGRLAAYA